MCKIESLKINCLPVRLFLVDNQRRVCYFLFADNITRLFHDEIITETLEAINNEDNSKKQ